MCLTSVGTTSRSSPYPGVRMGLQRNAYELEKNIGNRGTPRSLCGMGYVCSSCSKIQKRESNESYAFRRGPGSRNLNLHCVTCAFFPAKGEHRNGPQDPADREEDGLRC